MPFFDWLEAGGTRPEWFKGSCKVTIGDALGGYFGARHTHIFGPEIKLICDPEDMLMGKLEEYLPLVSGLLSGVGGNVSWVYGSNTSATYVGPKMEIRRAESISKVSDYTLAHAKMEVDGKKQDNPDVIDKATSRAAAVLSILMCAAAAALDLAIRFEYEEISRIQANDSKSDHTKEKECEGYEETVESLKIACYAVTGRLMALLKILEKKGSWADFAKQWGKEATFVGLIATNVVLGAIYPFGWAGLIYLYEEKNMKQAIKDAAAALTEE